MPDFDFVEDSTEAERQTPSRLQAMFTADDVAGFSGIGVRCPFCPPSENASYTHFQSVTIAGHDNYDAVGSYGFSVRGDVSALEFWSETCRHRWALAFGEHKGASFVRVVRLSDAIGRENGASGPKPIETQYKGYRFRSRLEARWAVFFDTLGLEWEYEKEGYDLGGVWYLPDFWVAQHNMFVEIKPRREPLDSELDKCARLSEQFHCPVLLLSGDPWEGAYDGTYYSWWNDDAGVMSFDHVVFGDCRKSCGAVWIIGDSIVNTITGCCKSDKFPIAHGPSIMAAYNAARGARFEHGEVPSLAQR